MRVVEYVFIRWFSYKGRDSFDSLGRAIGFRVCTGLDDGTSR